LYRSIFITAMKCPVAISDAPGVWTGSSAK
jgi:hypothetical protein